MRRSFAVALLAAAALTPAVTAAQTVTAPLGRAVRVPLGGAAASDVVVGNPKVADVTVVSPSVVFVSGKSFGSTNVIVMDRTGRTLFNGTVNVPMPEDGQVSVMRGPKTATYYCSPSCDRPVMEHGDDREMAGSPAPEAGAGRATATVPATIPGAPPLAASAMR
jgi:hypothetical protein